MSVIDFVRKNLCEDIWVRRGDSYTMRPDVRQRLYDDAIQTLKQAKFVKPEQWTHFYLIGSIASYQWDDNSDVDVTVFIDTDKFDQYESGGTSNITDTIRGVLKPLDAKLPGTNHMIAYYCRTDTKFSSDGVYDIVKNEWVREPSIKNTVVDHEIWETAEQIAQRIDLKSGNLRRDLVDHTKLRKFIETLDNDELVEYKWRALARESMVIADIIDLVSEYDDLHTRRKEILEFDELLLDGSYEKSRIHLPENVIYKILERYGYIQMFNMIKKIEKERKTNDDQFYDELMELVGLSKVAKKCKQTDARADIRKYMKYLYNVDNDVYKTFVDQLTKRFKRVK